MQTSGRTQKGCFLQGSRKTLNYGTTGFKTNFTGSELKKKKKRKRFFPNEYIKLYSYKNNLFEEFYFRFRISDVLHVSFLGIQVPTPVKNFRLSSSGAIKPRE